MNNSTNTQIVNFHGAEILTAMHNGEPFVAMRPIADALGLSWSSQHRKLKSSWDKFNCAHMTMVAMDEKLRNVVCLPLRKLNGWLFSINCERVHVDIRNKVIAYQEECFAVLHDYWTKGEAINPHLKTKKALPSGLTLEQQDVIKAMVRAKAETFSADKRAGATIKQWSAIKSKFGCSYKEIEPQHFTEVLSLLARIDLEGELLPKEQPAVSAQPAMTAEQIFDLPPNSRLISSNHDGKTIIQNIANSAVVPVGQVISLRRDFLNLQQLNMEMMERLQVLLGDKSPSILNKPLGA